MSNVEDRVKALKDAGYKFNGKENNSRVWVKGDWNKLKTSLLALSYTEQAGVLSKVCGDRTVSVTQSGDKVIVTISK